MNQRLVNKTMKLLTLNFLTCARRDCKTSPDAFPLHPREAELEIVETEINLKFLANILPRVEWEALRKICEEVRVVVPFHEMAFTDLTPDTCSSVSRPFQTRCPHRKT